MTDNVIDFAQLRRTASENASAELPPWPPPELRHFKSHRNDAPSRDPGMRRNRHEYRRALVDLQVWEIERLAELRPIKDEDSEYALALGAAQAWAKVVQGLRVEGARWTPALNDTFCNLVGWAWWAGMKAMELELDLKYRLGLSTDTRKPYYVPMLSFSDSSPFARCKEAALRTRDMAALHLPAEERELRRSGRDR